MSFVAAPSRITRGGPFFHFSSGGHYCDEYEAVIRAAEADKVMLPSVQQRNIDNDRIEMMRAEGIWDDLDFFYWFNTDGSVGFAKYDWKNPTGNKLPHTDAQLSFTVKKGIRILANGLSLSYVPGTNWTQNDACLFAGFEQINNNSIGIVNTVSNLTFTGFPSAPTYFIQWQFNDNSTRNTIVDVIKSTPYPMRLVQIQRTASNFSAIWTDGVRRGTSAAASVGVPAVITLFGAATNNAILKCLGAGASLSGKEEILNRIVNTPNF